MIHRKCSATDVSSECGCFPEREGGREREREREREEGRERERGGRERERRKIVTVQY